MRGRQGLSTSRGAGYDDARVHALRFPLSASYRRRCNFFCGHRQNFPHVPSMLANFGAIWANFGRHRPMWSFRPIPCEIDYFGSTSALSDWVLSLCRTKSVTGHKSRRWVATHQLVFRSPPGAHIKIQSRGKSTKRLIRLFAGGAASSGNLITESHLTRREPSSCPHARKQTPTNPAISEVAATFVKCCSTASPGFGQDAANSRVSRAAFGTGLSKPAHSGDKS